VSSKIKRGSPVKALVGVYKGRRGTLKVVVEDSPCCYGVKLKPESPEETMPPIIWFREGQIEEEA